ncbi:MAG TPA: hypothetical protein DDY18_03930, partial [Flavobacterium sp.]|nr:hypothetical protein [Flavobacterium sp.]
MSKLSNLINSLGAFTIVIVENEFTYEDKPLAIISKYTFSPESQRNSILEELNKKGYVDLATQISTFTDAFTKIESHDEGLIKSLAPDYMDKYLEKVGKKEILTEELIKSITGALENDKEKDILKSSLLKHGIYASTNDAHYKEILDEIHSIKGCKILLYKHKPTNALWEEFTNDISASIEGTKSNFCLAIIDKSLQGGSGDEEGKALITELIAAHKQDNKIKCICCLYTSKPKEQTPPQKYEDYFVQEFIKGTKNAVEEITKILAQSAYAEVFNSLRVKLVDSTANAMDIVLKNQVNIKYIIDESHKEGIPPYDSIKYWFNLAAQLQFDKQESEDYNLVGGLTSFFTQDYLEDHPELASISKELEVLNNYELFDPFINKKHLPISPGDIWLSNGEYYILIGQLCDLLLRRENKGEPNIRNAKIGELIKAEIIDIQQGIKREKFRVRIENHRKIIYVDNFYDEVEKRIRTLKIDMSTPNIYFADLSVLDLCMFNNKGECKIDMSTPIEESIKKLLPENRDLYYTKLQGQYQNVGINKVRQLAAALELDDPIFFSKIRFTEDSGVLKYDLRRIYRLRGRYYDSVYNNYLNNKGRIDLNLIDNAPEKSRTVKVFCQLGNDGTTRKEAEVNLWENQERSHFRRSELKEKLAVEFHALIEHLDEIVDISDKQKVEVIDKVDYHELIFRYKLQDKYVETSMSEMDYRYVFRSNHKQYENSNFAIEGSNETKPLKGSKISIEDLKKGVLIAEQKLKIKLINGII